MDGVTVTRTRQSRGRLSSALGIGEGEQGLAFWTALLFLVTQSTHGLGANAADTLFLLRFGVEELPRMIVFAGLAVMALVLGHTVGLTSWGERRWLPIVTAASALWVLLNWLGVFLDEPVIYPIVWVSTQGIIMVTFTMMWNAAGAVCTTRQAKRLFPLFAAAGVMGGILGNLATGPITSWFGTQSLLLAQTALLGLSTVLVLRLFRLMPDGQPGESGSTVLTQLRGAFRAIRSSTLLRMAAAVGFLIWALFYMVVFPFNEAVVASFETEAEVATFLGIFSSAATAVTFVVALLLAKRLFSRLGIVVSLLILPVAYAAGFGVWLIEFGLPTASLVRGAQWVTLNAIGATAFTALFNVLTGMRRAQVMAFMTAVPSQLGVIAGGLLLVASQGASDVARFGLGLVLALIAVVVVVAMRPAYVEAILASVKKGLTSVFLVPSPGLFSPTDAEARRVLESHLTDERPEARAYALSALARLEDHSHLRDMSEYLRDLSPVVRTAAYYLMCEREPERFRLHIRDALSDETADVRIGALHYAATHDASDEALNALADPDLRVRATAAAIVGSEKGTAVALVLLNEGDAVAKRTLLAELIRSGVRLAIDMRALLDDDDAEVRALAARLGMTYGLRPEDLRSLLDDRSIRVRRAAGAGLATTESGRRLLLEILQVGTVNETDAALRALVPHEQLTEDFVEWARGEAERAARLDLFRRGMAGAMDTPVARFLKSVLDARTARLEQWVLMAMTTTETTDIMPVVQRGVAASDVETRAQAIEALETIGDRRILGVLLPLLDRAGGESLLEEREALRQLSSDFDPWLRALAMRCLAEAIQSDLTLLHRVARTDRSDLVRESVPSLSTMALEKSDTLGVMDRVLALQRVHMFSELDPEDIEALARSTNEVVYGADEMIYQEGAEGSEGLMIIDGSAIVTATRGDETRVVAEYGPGDSVGELALLGSGVRSADVTAGPNGLHGVVITKADFVSILEERSSVALGMLSTLAERMAQET